jgi:hypothetical protein
MRRQVRHSNLTAQALNWPVQVRRKQLAKIPRFVALTGRRWTSQIMTSDSPETWANHKRLRETTRILIGVTQPTALIAFIGMAERHFIALKDASGSASKLIHAADKPAAVCFDASSRYPRVCLTLWGKLMA